MVDRLDEPAGDERADLVERGGADQVEADGSGWTLASISSGVETSSGWTLVEYLDLKLVQGNW